MHNYLCHSPLIRIVSLPLVLLLLVPACARCAATAEQEREPIARSGVLDHRKLLEAQTFWDNRDWDWYDRNIPFFQSPDPDIDTTYYYRWELVTKHLTYGSPDTGYVYTEFIDRPFWSGRYGSISCAAGHHLYEVRWLHDRRYAQDYARYWFHTQGAQPRRYSCWLADAVWAVQAAQGDRAFAIALLPDLVRNYQAWEKERFDEKAGLFWQAGHDDGMEYNIHSRQSQDLMRGAPGYRPTLNSYMWADARAIERIARLAGDTKTANEYAAKAAGIKANLQKQLWDPKRHFFFHKYREDEQRDGFVVKADSLSEQTGRFAGSGRGREEIGFVPWQFNLPDAGYESAWQFLMDPTRFYDNFGPTTAERDDPMYHLSPTCCWWSGQSWPYATTQTLEGMANLLNNYKQNQVTRADYYKLLRIYALTHRKDGKPYIAEAANPDTGSFKGHDSYNHSEHYFHSAYCDLIITGLAGLRPRADDVLEVNPLAPEQWDYFALDHVLYHGHEIAIVWDRNGSHYGRGAGLHVLVDGNVVAGAPKIGKLTAKLPAVVLPEQPRAINYAVNNDLSYYPRAIASYTNPKTPLAKVNDGNYWYTASPPNRWTCEGSGQTTDWCGIDFGIARPIDTVKLYVLDDGDDITAPLSLKLEYFDGRSWQPVPGARQTPAPPRGHCVNAFRFPLLHATKLRAVMTHGEHTWCGLSEFEAWGPGTLPITPAPEPPGSLATNRSGKGFPAASASFTSPYDSVKEANDGVVQFSPTPRNRWTAYGSPNKSDWLQIDFGSPKKIGRVVLDLYDDGGGVQAPAEYNLQLWDGNSWKDIRDQKKSPRLPTGGQANTTTFPPVKTNKLRVIFTHKGDSRAGLTEIEAWEK